MEESGDMVFTEILDNFIKILENVPANLKGMCMTLLYFFSTIDIALTVYQNINNPDFNYINWAKIKILKVGFIILAIKSYEWFLNLIKDFFLSIGTKGLGLSLSSNNYFNDPSAIWDKGREIGGLIIDQLSWRPATYIFILLGLLTYIGFFLLAMRIIICWVEYYFLTGFSIIFLPCGALDLGLEYYKNVFKTIISCSIKLGVFNMWLLICDKLMKSIMVAEKKYDLDAALVVCGTVYVLVAIMLSMPSITTGLLTGSPAVNAGTAMAAATGAVGHTYRGTKEVVYGAWNGMKTGGKAGVKGGAIIGGTIAGPVGVGVGKIVGGAFGAVGGAAIGGSYAGARYAVFKEKAKKKDDDGNSNNSSSNNSSSNNSNNSGSSGNSSANNSSNGNNSNFNNSGSNNTVTNNQSSSVNNSITPVGGVTSNPQPSINNSNTSQNNVNSGNNSNSVANNPSDSNSSTTNNSPDSTTKEVSSSNTESSTGISNDVNSNETTSNSNVSNIEKSNTTTTNTTSTIENTTSDVEDNAKKSGIKVNGGEAGKLPDWMQGDY